MNNVSGINSSSASQRATDLKLKCEYLQELHGGDKGVVFATGTPISNSMTEMYTMQTYLQPNVLKDLGITYFDGWAADFGETVTAMELSPSGKGYKTKTRFAKFTNLPELLKLYRSFADVQTSEQVKLDVPEAERMIVKLKPSDRVIEYAEEIAKRAERISSGGVDPHDDNMLKVTSDGKKLALDPRCHERTAEDEPGSKINECVLRILEVWENTAEQKGTQIVFCDLSTPKKRYEEYVYGVDFDVYNDLKHKLVERGIPEQEIAFIHDAKTEEQKQKLFDAVNSGKVRVLIGSTEKCGAGTNVQKHLVALHHLDTPYRPSDMEQREGRIIRQGNTNQKVQIFTYVMERTFDSYSYQILENKQRFISQINRGDLTVRVTDDIDEATLTYGEIKAITSANPKIKRKFEVDNEISQLRLLEGEYRNNLYNLQYKIRRELPENIQQQTLILERIRADIELVKENYRPDPFSISVNGVVYTEKKAGGEALLSALQTSPPETVVGEYYGFKISMKPMAFLSETRSVYLTANGRYEMEIGTSGLGIITRLDNNIKALPEVEKNIAERLESLKQNLAAAKAQEQQPFEHEEQLNALLAEQAQLNEELSLDKSETVISDVNQDDKTEAAPLEPDDDEDDEGEFFMGIPEREETEDKKMTLKDFLDKELPDVKWLDGRTNGFTEYEVSDLIDDLKVAFEGSEFDESGGKVPFDDWYDLFSENELRPLLEERMTKEDETSEYRERTKHGYDVENIITHNGRDYAIVKRGKEFILGFGYDEKTGEWGQGYYGYESYEKAEGALYAYFDAHIAGTEKVDYEKLIRDSVEAEYQKFYQEELKKSPEDLITKDNYKIRFFNELSVFLGEDIHDNLSEGDLEALYADSPQILESLYDYYLSTEYASINNYSDIADMIRDYNDSYHEDIVEDRYSERVTIVQRPSYVIQPLYMQSFDYARENGELPMYRESYRLCEECKEGIEKTIGENFDGKYLKKGFEDKLIQQHGLDRFALIR